MTTISTMSENGNNGSKGIHGRESADALWTELGTYCKSDLLSEDGLCEFFEKHGLTPNNYNGNFNYGFFLSACKNERVDEGVIRCLLENFPTAASATDEDGWTPLHHACYYNKSMTRGIIQLLIDAAPDSVRSVDNHGRMPLHVLGGNKRINETNAIQSLKLLIEKCPEAVRHADNRGGLPIHIAAKRRSPDFCQVLIEAYPGSERLANASGLLPLHFACGENTLAAVEYLYKLYPDAINHASTTGYYPIHCAIMGLSFGDNPAAVVEIVRFLLDCDPNVKLQKNEGRSLLRCACRCNYNDSNIDAALEVIKAIYDAHPEAIEDDNISSEMRHYHEQVQSFVSSQLGYARQAKDHRMMTTPDMNGQLPLHRALKNNAPLGSIKLLAKGNPSALRVPDDNFATPFHIACEHHDPASVVQYLLDLDRKTLRAVDIDNNTALHYACRGAKYDTIALLLDKYDAMSVSKRNAQKKLPIDLLWESDRVSDRESLEYMGSVFRLLRANPEMMVMTSNNIAAEKPSDADKTRIRKKRKCGHGQEG